MEKRSGERRHRSGVRGKRRLRLPGGLMKNSVCISTGVCLAILIAFFVNYMIIHKWYCENVADAHEAFFEEIASALEDVETDIVKIADSVNVNDTVTGYIRADELNERWSRLREVQQLASSLMKLEEHIQALSIYNDAGELIAMEGVKFAPVSELPEDGDTLRISGRVQVEGDAGAYFQAVIPVYERQERGMLARAGSVVLLFSVERLQEIADIAAAAYSGEDTYVAVRDRQETVLAEAGNADVYGEYAGAGAKSGEESRKFLQFQQDLPQSGWQILYVAKKNSYMYYMDRVQIVNILTYIVTIAALIYLCYMMYRKVMQPLKRQLAFVVNYTKDTRQRMEVWDESEFGELEKEVNEMLDRIEELNRKIIEEREHCLALEYSKKQTEILAYKNQINPHFMHNTLECIRGMAVYHGEKEIAKLTEAMSRMFQYNVRGKETVTVAAMLRSIRDYAVIIEYRFMGRITVRVEAQDEVRERTLPKMLVQPLVENAVHHGLEPKVDKGTVTLAVSLADGRICIRVRDDGIGMTEQELERQKRKFLAEEERAGGLDLLWRETVGAPQSAFEEPEDGRHREIGLANVARRLQLFYGDTYSLRIWSREGEGSEFCLELPERVSFGIALAESDR